MGPKFVLIPFLCLIFILLSQGKADFTHFDASLKHIEGFESLAVDKVEVKETDIFGVRKWLTLTIDTNVYALGIKHDALVLVRGNLFKLHSEKHHVHFESIEIDAEGLSSAVLFKLWNPQRNIQEPLVALLYNSSTSLKWCRFQDDNKLEFLKESETQFPESVSHMEVFQIDEELKLWVIPNCSKSACRSNIYNVQIFPSYKITFSHHIDMDEQPEIAAVGVVEQVSYLAFTQSKIGVVLYRYQLPPPSNQKTFGSFTFHANIHGPSQVADLTFFQVSSKLHLAVGGQSPEIYKLVSPTKWIQTESFKSFRKIAFVSAWLVLPLQSYRDDVLVLAQIDENHDGLRSRIIKVFSYDNVNKVRFQELPQCSTPSNFLKDCFKLQNNDVGLRGAKLIHTSDDKTLSLLIPSGFTGPSTLVSIHTKLRVEGNPIQEEIELIQETRQEVEAKLKGYLYQIAQLRDVLQDVLHTTEDNYISGEWLVQEVESETYGGIIPGPEFFVPGNGEDVAVDLAELHNHVQELRTILPDFNKLEDAAVPSDGEIHLTGEQTFAGGFEAESVSFKSLQLTRLNGESVSDLLRDAVRIGQEKFIGGIKTVSSVSVNNTMFSTLNNVPAEDLIFNKKDELVNIDGSLEFSEDLHVFNNLDVFNHGKVNGLDFSTQLLRPGHFYEGKVYFKELKAGDVRVEFINHVQMYPYSLRALVNGVGDVQPPNMTKYDVVDIDGTFRVGRINDIYWNDFINRVVWKNATLNYLEGVTQIQGTVTAEKRMGVEVLNSLKFPTDYLNKNQANQLITGSKTFNNKVLASNVHVTENIGGVSVNSLITKTSDQDVYDGDLRINELYVPNDIKVEWGINGMDLKHIKYPSPKLEDGGVITADLSLRNMTVFGKIIVLNTYDNVSFKNYMHDIVLDSDNSNTVVKGKKTFTDLQVGSPGISVTSGNINELAINEFFRSDLNPHLDGEVVFDELLLGNLQLDGLWNYINIAKLDDETVRLDGKQDCSKTTLVFATQPSFNSISIKNSLNDYDLQDYPLCDSQTSHQQCFINRRIAAHTIRLAGNVEVDGPVCGWDLHQLDGERLSRSRSQTISAPLRFDRVYVSSYFEVSNFNNIPVNTLGSVPRSEEEYRKLLTSGRFGVNELIVEGSVNTKSVNSYYNLPKLVRDFVRLDGKNPIKGNLIFEEKLFVDNLTVEGLVNNLYILELAADAVPKSSDINVSGIKTFKKGFSVTNDIVTEKYNGMNMSNILTKSKAHDLKGNLVIRGNLFTESVNSTWKVNNIFMSDLKGRYSKQDNTHYLKGNVECTGDLEVESLFVEKVNDVELKRFLDSVVKKNEDAKITGKKTFKNMVNFQNVTVKGLVKNVDLPQLWEDLVKRSSETPTTINGKLLIFANLKAMDTVTIKGDLITKEIYGSDIEDWTESAIYLNRTLPERLSGLVFENVTANANLNLKLLNSADMSKLILLNSEQIFNSVLRIAVAKFENNVDVLGNVNNKNLKTEYLNTLTTSGVQTINGQLKFIRSVDCHGNIDSKGLVSYKNVSDLTTLDTPQSIKSSLTFKHLECENLNVKETLSGISMQQWRDSALLKYSGHTQTVTGNWKLKKNVDFKEEVSGEGKLCGENLVSLVREGNEVISETAALQQNVIDEWLDFCRDINSLLKKATHQPFHFQQFEMMQNIRTERAIASIHVFEIDGGQYLIVSYIGTDCKGAAYKWDKKQTYWRLVRDDVPDLGNINRWATVQTKDHTFVATSSTSKDCAFKDGNIWLVRSKLQFKQQQSIDAWENAHVSESDLYTLGRSGIHRWQMQDGIVQPSETWPIDNPEDAHFVPRSAGFGVTTADGKYLTNLTSKAPIRTANSHLPPRGKGNTVVSMTLTDGRKLIVTIKQSKVLVVYEDALSGKELSHLSVNKAEHLSILQLAGSKRSGQTLVAFIENKKTLRVVEYKGVQGMVDIAKAVLPLPVDQMVAVRLPTRNLIHPHPFLLLISANNVFVFEVELAGDPLDHPPLDCEF